MLIMPEHGDFDSENNKWFCSYWQSEQEWYEIHNYLPTNRTDDQDVMAGKFETENVDT